MYKIFLIEAALLSAAYMLARPRKIKLKYKRGISKLKIIDLADNIICKNKKLKSIKEKYAAKLRITSVKSELQCSAYIIGYLLISLIIALAAAFIFSILLSIWHFIVLISISVFCILIYSGTLYIKIKMDKIYNQFPEALQIFIDEYIEYKNIKKAIDNSYSRMPMQVGGVFEKVSRQLSSGENFKRSIMSMADGLDYIWAHTFAEILILSYAGAGNIEEDLLYLNTLICEEATIEEEMRTEAATNKIIFIVLNILTIIIFVINMAANSLSKYLYFFTATGNGLLIMWLCFSVIGLIILNITEKV